MRKSIDFGRKFIDFIREITLDLEAVFLPSLEIYGLTMIQSRILFEIYLNQKITVGSLCHTIGSSSGNASIACKKLEKQGYINRIRDTADERVVNLQLTGAGRKTVKSIEQEFQEKYDPVLSNITEDDFHIIMLGMEKIKDIFIQLKNTQN